MRFCEIFEGVGNRTTGRPVNQFDGVDDGHFGRGADLYHAAKVAGGDHLRRQAFDIGNFASLEAAGQLRQRRFLDEHPQAP